MKDPAVEEIRERRRKLIKERYHGSVERFIDEAMAWAKDHPDRVVDLRKKKRARAVV
ncbi:MAG: hypothetical protein R6V03_06945 [Kiritimatiellia bacterium]